ncbi:AAA family ATPase [Nostoc sp. FACHB-87]|uniref:ATP-binding sensor histidine kinase n=1 Tax=Nostocaceae TaxID=1162 RepID=UPI001687AF90|nr:MULTISPECIES: ATP-binding sensor histidine kinase [Nostocaceae]MBD2455301.1 AAA family ATPase [Nostoc sp. FACHB-87]MBD2476874.1 AAA family ATPase [Anabaena sp. FACHB-83]
MFDTIVNIPGYKLTKELYNGSRTLVYRGYRENDALKVVIKLLKNPYPSFRELVLFRNQYTIAKSLQLPEIIQTYSLEPYQNAYALVMEDFGGISLKEWMEQQESNLSLRDFLPVAIAMSNILNILYQNRIIHKDIKPTNILINLETKQVKLIDFSIASLLPRETQMLISPNVLEGTLGYLSPEQTGRMNRGIDYRTDFYSLGISFYELLTGELPFQSEDAMELVHCHIAKTAPLVHEINSQIPPVISEIVYKLMAKNAEDRYQSALGLKYDLEKCWLQLEDTGSIESFPIAQRDLCDRFLIPEKLYGREQEIKLILDTFDRVAQGSRECILVGGFSGIGKTSIVNEVHKPIVRQRGYFISGKFDQFQRNIPYAAIVTAFRQLVQQLLTESEIQFQKWQDKLQTALGNQGQIIIEVIPEIELIIGKQPPVPILGPIETQMRFNSLFQRFIGIFGAFEHPLVIFLDDLQWADIGTLKLIELMMTDANIQNLLIIGAYRDNEVDAAHPFILLVEELKKQGQIINQIILNPLGLEQINQLVADTLYSDIAIISSLANLIIAKTEGNPFFVNEFLKALYQEELLIFNSEMRIWQWDIAQIEARGITDDVIELMIGKLQKLPETTQKILSLAACIGANFDLNTLSIICEKSHQYIYTNLELALQPGFIIPTSKLDEQLLIQNYCFGHDRIQQAAYALIPSESRKSIHINIARLILRNISLAEISERLFEITDHFNSGIELIDNLDDCLQVARLNLQAAQKAKTAMAYAAALKYMIAGMSLLNEAIWEYDSNLAMSMYRERVDIEYLNGNFENSLQWIEHTLLKARTDLEKADIYTQQMVLNVLAGRYFDAVQITYQAFKLLGVDVPEHLPESVAKAGMKKIKASMLGKSISSLMDLPMMSDPAKKLAMKLLDELLPATYVAKPELFSWVIVTMVLYSLEFGLHPSSCHGFSCYGMLLVFETEEYQDAYEFGNIALLLAQKWNEALQISRTAHVLSAFLMSWVKPVHLSYQLQALVKSDLTYTGYSYAECFGNRLFAGQNIEELLAESQIIQLELEKFENKYTEVVNAVFRFSLQELAGEAVTTIECDRQFWTEADFIASCKAQNRLAGLCTHYILRSLVYYLAGDLPQAYAQTCKAAELIYTRRAGMIVPAFYLYHCLILAAYYFTTTEDEQKNILEELQTRLQQLQIWSNNCHENFEHLYLLVKAEINHIAGKGLEVIEIYDQAIASAHEYGFIHHEAIANEQAAKFLLNKGKDEFAYIYLKKAYLGYQQWRANAKCKNLASAYPQVFMTNSTPHFHLLPETTISKVDTIHPFISSQSTTQINSYLDLESILKASQILAREIHEEKLLKILLQVMVENTGAQKCVLLISESEQLIVKAIYQIGNFQILTNPETLENTQEVPISLINVVKRTLKDLMIIDATTEHKFVGDLYIERHQPKSIMCSPILNQGKLMGVIYLENNVATGVFTIERLQVINLLSSQAAISLENARLYQQVQKALEDSLLKQISINQASVAVWWIEKDARIFYVNDAVCKDLGYLREEIIGKYIFDFDTTFKKELWAEHWQAVCEKGAFTIESCHQCKNGQIFPVEMTVNYVDFQGKEYNFVFSRNISDRKQAEAAVQRKSQELETALQDLQQAQLQIVQSEKMSALGNLVAGVAHEMNNPLGFIAASLQQAKPNLSDMITHLKLYQESLQTPEYTILEHAEEIDLDYILEDFPKMIESMVMACDRLKNISTSLRTFSRADQNYKVKFNLHEGIDSTILILKHRLKANNQRPAIEVLTNYGDLPQINCFPGQLNQVFMNILANAIDALEEASIGKTVSEIKAHPNCITITTAIVDKYVNISIADNANGMGEDIKQKIFDHLFTTKSVGKGTGLGLAIALQIIEEKHGGKITVNSVVGEGTEFIISLPIA